MSGDPPTAQNKTFCPLVCFSTEDPGGRDGWHPARQPSPCVTSPPAREFRINGGSTTCCRLASGRRVAKCACAPHLHLPAVQSYQPACAGGTVLLGRRMSRWRGSAGAVQRLRSAQVLEALARVGLISCLAAQSASTFRSCAQQRGHRPRPDPRRPIRRSNRSPSFRPGVGA